jgi:mRNA-degrading endonuclease RelE of RelBE toxin-antitoxin system
MGFKARYSKSAENYLDSQTQSVRSRIIEAVDKLPNGNVIKLKGREGYRLTIGGFRV